jgi:hypothetical protein
MQELRSSCALQAEDEPVSNFAFLKGEEGSAAQARRIGRKKKSVQGLTEEKREEARN